MSELGWGGDQVKEKAIDLPIDQLLDTLNHPTSILPQLYPR